jgi:hypothetical protein
MKKNLIFPCLISILISVAFNLSAQVSISNDNSDADNSAMLDIKSTNKGFLIPRMTSSQRMAIINPSNGLMVYQTDDVSGLYYYNGTIWQHMSESTSNHYSGELWGGGVVFWVDNTGQHGLICSLTDISTPQAWSNVTSTSIGATAQSNWNGQGNTNAIITQPGHTSSAAKLCDDYTNANYGTGVYSDWYLPTTDQLSLLYQAKYQVNKTIDNDGNSLTKIISINYYWSSNEHSDSGGWRFDFTHGYTDGTPKSGVNYIRAVRTF